MSANSESLDCACCGGDLPSTLANGYYSDGEELKCDDCNSANYVAIDEGDEEEGEGPYPYISHYVCEHGLRDDAVCDLCEGSS